MKTSSKHAIFTEWILPLGLAALGFFAGRYSIIHSFHQEVDGMARGYTLGSLLDEERKHSILPVYHDGESTLTRVDEISWAVPTVPTPFVGNAPMPGTHGNAHINAQQFRDTRKVVIPKPAGTYRIFLTGGSTAFGSGAPSQERTIGAYLQALLARTAGEGPRYEVFTFANPAWASTQERIAIENRLSEMEPDLVISFSGNNDVHWGSLGRNVLWFRSYADDHYWRLIRLAYGFADQPSLPDAAPNEPTRVPPETIAARLLKNVELSAAALAREGAEYLFVLQPTLAISGKELSTREAAGVRDFSYFQASYDAIQTVLRTADGNGFRYLDLSTVFDDLGGDEEIFLDSYHFGDKGYERIAVAIHQRLLDDNPQADSEQMAK